MFVWAFAAAVGLVTAGLAGTAYAIVAGERPHPEILYRLNHLTPLKVAALVLYGPMAFSRGGFDYLDENPLFGVLLVGIGVVWSFFLGVVILVTFFGFT